MDNLAEQANHSAAVAHLHYGLSIGDVKCFGQDDLFRSRRACEAWHRLLKLYESPVLCSALHCTEPEQPELLSTPTLDEVSRGMSKRLFI